MAKNTDKEYAEELVPEAIAKWKKTTKDRLEPMDIYEFAKFIGYPYPDFVNQDRRNNTFYIVNIRNERVREIIDKINSDYGDAIIKMLELKVLND